MSMSMTKAFMQKFAIIPTFGLMKRMKKMRWEQHP